MVDNAPEARPHSGLAQADVVYEAPAEAGIPRLLALYLRGQQVDRVEPIRSARHYFVYLTAEYGVPLVHIGYSPQALAAMEQTGTVRIDESAGDGGFTRDPRRRAPHNAYVSSMSIEEELQKRGITTQPSLGGLAFGAYQPGPQPATRIRIPYPCCISFVAQYAYDPDSKSYTRSMNDRPHVDAVTGEQYAATSVIIQQVGVQAIPNDPAGRLEVGVVGSGKAILVAEGTQVPLQWRKTSPRDTTQFTRDDGKPFSLPEGQVWIEVLALEASVQVS
jgi:hypothetical protein